MQLNKLVVFYGVQLLLFYEGFLRKRNYAVYKKRFYK